MNLEHLDHPLSSRATIAGMWQDIDGVSFLLRPVNKRNRHSRVFTATHGPLKTENQHVFVADCILIGWDGLQCDGEPLIYDHATAVDLLKLHPALCDKLLEEGMRLGLESEKSYQEDAETVKKSPSNNGNGAGRKRTKLSQSAQELNSLSLQN